MARFYLLCLVAGGMALSTAAQMAAPDAPEPKDSMQWFQRASDRMTLRMPGSPPFHLTVKFQAFAGQEMLDAGQKSDFIAGEGDYEETWLSVHEWRREVTLAGYHATEVESNGVRKLQASSDYEPSRILMVLDSLFSPIPRSFMTKEFHAGSGWKLDHVSSGNLSLVRLSKSNGSQRADYTDSYYFLPASGVLAMSNADGLVTVWSNDKVFAGKVIPTSLSIKAGNHDLLTAAISIETAPEPVPGQFDLPGPAAEPGMTLRPLHWNEVRLPDLSDSFSYMSGQLGPSPVFSVAGILDRHGHFRELEVLLSPNPKDAGTIIRHFRREQEKPAKIDGSPCQFSMHWRMM